MRVVPSGPMPAHTASVLIAGMGNVFYGDDAFGVEVVRRIAQRALPDGVRAVDFGIRGFDLAYAMGGVSDVILVDAARRGGAPGTLYLLELDPAGPGPAEIDTHAMGPANVLRLAAALGGRPGRVHLVGCEPSDVDFDAGGLSPAVDAAIAGAIELVMTLVERSRGEAVLHA
jgi:hydrogenase maturation protease